MKTNQEFWTFGIEGVVYCRGEFCRLQFGKETVIWLIKGKVLLSINENDSMLRLRAQKKTLELTLWSRKLLRGLLFFECCFELPNHFS